jgi:hypothetical protein
VTTFARDSKTDFFEWPNGAATVQLIEGSDHPKVFGETVEEIQAWVATDFDSFHRNIAVFAAVVADGSDRNRGTSLGCAEQ